MRHADPERLAPSIVPSQSRQVIPMQTWHCQWYRDCSDDLLRRAEQALTQLEA